MSKHISLHQHKDANPLATLWWQPIFSMQKEANHYLRSLFSNNGNSFIPASAWNMEENVFNSAQKNIHRLFSELFNNRQMLAPWFAGLNTEPYVDIIENSKSFKVKAEIPGIKTDDLDVSVSENSLTISGNKKEEKKEEGDNYIRHECFCGSFSRTIALPEEADMENAEATLENSILTVEIPKKSVSGKKKRTVNVEDTLEEEYVGEPTNFRSSGVSALRQKEKETKEEATKGKKEKLSA